MGRWTDLETHLLLRFMMELADDASLVVQWEEISRRLRRAGFERSSESCEDRYVRVLKKYEHFQRTGKQLEGGAYRYSGELDALASKVALTAAPVVPVSSLPLVRNPQAVSSESSETEGSPRITEDAGSLGKRKGTRRRCCGCTKKIIKLAVRLLNELDKRDEVWRAREGDLLARERELHSHDRDAAGCRDAAVMALLQLAGFVPPAPGNPSASAPTPGPGNPSGSAPTPVPGNPSGSAPTQGNPSGSTPVQGNPSAYF